MRDDPVVINLVARARDGDQRAWNEIVNSYAPLVWSICSRYKLAGRISTTSARPSGSSWSSG